MPTLQINEIFANRYLLKKLIGVGGYSQVWLAGDIKSGNLEVAIKIFAPGQGLDDKGLELFSKEYALVFNMNHPGLLKPTYFDDFEGSPYLVMQYCAQGSVFGKIGDMSERELARFMQQAASALAYLHGQDPPIIHQDIKPDNFLIDSHNNYLLADFGISSKIRRTLTKSMGARVSTGTLAYMPPEKFSADKQIIKAGDIFSLGATMYELLSGDLPFGDHGGMVMMTGAQVPNLPPGFNPELNTLLKYCMAKEPWERPTAEQLEETATKFLQFGQWPVVGSPVPNPVPEPPGEPEQPRAGRKTQAIPQSGLLSGAETQPQPQPQPAPKKSTPLWIIAAVVLVIGMIVAIAWPKGPSAVNTSQAKPSIEWANIPAGTFTMGSPIIKINTAGNEIQHQVTLNAFKISKYEVTFEQYDAFCNATGRSKQSDSGWGRGNRPVINVSWHEATAFAEWMDCRLPTEAEWEYACRAGSTTPFNTGNCLNTSQANYDGNYPEPYCTKGEYRQKTLPVGSFTPNAWGLFDMHGNVWEWCSDWYGDYQSTLQNNPKGPVLGSSRVNRGGSWDISAHYCRAAYRNYNPPETRGDQTGFRLVSPK